MVWRARRSDWIAERGRALALLLRRPGDAERVRRGLGASSGTLIRRRRQIPIDRRSPLLPRTVSEVAMSRLPRGLWLLCATACTLQACGGGGTGPAPAKLANPANTAAQLQSVSAPTATGTFQSFAVLLPQFAAAGSASLAIGAPVVVAPGPALAWSAAATAALREALAGQPIEAAIFPDTARGKTFLWDTISNRYVVSTAAGAPANGVRFRLYAIQPFTTVPTRPLSMIGYVDLTDQSSPSAAVLGVAIVGTTGPTPATYASYSISRPVGQSAGVSLAGFVSDGVTRLDLTSALTATLTALTAQTTVDVAAQGVHISETASVSGTASVAVTTDFSLTSGGETVRSNGTVTADTATRTVGGNIAVTVNGQAFATITVGPTGPSYAGASGVQLTAADQTALRSLFTASINLFLTVFLLTEPALVLNL